MSYKKLDSRGDTIVEVLFAIVIVSVVLGAAFVSSNRSLNGTRMSQERVEALKIVQGQVELLGVALGDSAKATEVFNPVKSPFCLENDLNVRPAASVNCKRGDENRYAISVTYTPATNTFKATAEWDRIVASSSKEQVNLFYKAHQP